MPVPLGTAMASLTTTAVRNLVIGFGVGLACAAAATLAGYFDDGAGVDVVTTTGPAALFVSGWVTGAGVVAVATGVLAAT